MGLFNKFKKENKKYENADVMDSEKNKKNSDIEPTENIQKEHVENELTELQNLLKEKNERLDTIMEKIQLSKNEYELKNGDKILVSDVLILFVIAVIVDKLKTDTQFRPSK